MTVAAASQRVPCSLCTSEFGLSDVIDVGGYPVCRPCLERVSREAPIYAPRKFQKVREGKVIAGVCGGLARYANFDPSWMQVLWVIATVMTGFALIPVYIILAFVMPTEPEGPEGNS